MSVTIDAGTWIRRFHPASAGATRLVCFPHAGGAASAYHRFSRDVAPFAEALCVQYPGREDRRGERLVGDVRELAAAITVALEPWRADRLAFFGHSMGAIVAFEVAHRMRAQFGRSPVVLFASARRAPSVHREGRVHLLDDAALVAEVRSLAGTAARVFDDPDLVRMVLPAIRGDYRAIETYRCVPGTRLDCPISVFLGDNDHRVRPEDAHRWHEHTTGACDVTTFRGGHFYLNDRRAEVVAEIRRRLGAHR